MVKLDIQKYLETETGLPTAEVAFTKPQKLPFVAILDEQSQDGDDYHARTITHDLAVEFYAERIDKHNEEKLEAAFEKAGWKYGKDRTWLADEKMFETIYAINFTEKR